MVLMVGFSELILLSGWPASLVNCFRKLFLDHCARHKLTLGALIFFISMVITNRNEFTLIL